jgi:hypothetical protein
MHHAGRTWAGRTACSRNTTWLCPDPTLRINDDDDDELRDDDVARSFKQMLMKSSHTQATQQNN